MINRYYWFDISLYIIIDRKRGRQGPNYAFEEIIRFELIEKCWSCISLNGREGCEYMFQSYYIKLKQLFIWERRLDTSY